MSALLRSLALSACCAACAAAGEIGPVLARLEASMADVQSVRAAFTQTRRSPLFEQALVLRGELGFERPARLAWRVREPVPYLLVLDEERFRQWDAETGRVQEGPLKGNPILGAMVEKMTGFFAGRFQTLTNDFEVTLAAERPLELLCTPRAGSAAAAMGQTLRVRFQDDERYVSVLEMADAQGGVTEIRMENTELNPVLPPGFWKVPPLD